MFVDKKTYDFITRRGPSRVNHKPYRQAPSKGQKRAYARAVKLRSRMRGLFPGISEHSEEPSRSSKPRRAR